MAAGYRYAARNFVIMLFCAFLIDGCLHRDPHVRLADGYAIIAISPNQPCQLVYKPEHDRRKYSDWTARRSTTPSNAADPGGTDFALFNSTTGELIEFSSEQEWQEATRERNAAPRWLAFEEINAIAQYGSRGRLIFGDCDRGYFLLDISGNELQVFGARQEWEAAIAAKTGKPPSRMRSPKSWLVQSRDRFTYLTIGGFIAITLPWVLAPILRTRRGRAALAITDNP